MEVKELGYNEAGMKQAGKRLAQFALVIGVVFGLLITLLGLTMTGVSIIAVCSYLFYTTRKK